VTLRLTTAPNKPLDDPLSSGSAAMKIRTGWRGFCDFFATLPQNSAESLVPNNRTGSNCCCAPQHAKETFVFRLVESRKRFATSQFSTTDLSCRELWHLDDRGFHGGWNFLQFPLARRDGWIVRLRVHRGQHDYARLFHGTAPSDAVCA
jgi:hypothetical protein